MTDSLESLLSQLDSSFEVVVVDNLSSDGSERILQDYDARGAIRLIRKRCSRGRGRQLAFENSSGQYVVSHLDMDDIFRPVLGELLDFYHQRAEGRVLVAISRPGDWGQNITIASRRVLTEIGGWRDLQYAEDWDLWSRAAKRESYAWTVFPVTENSATHPRRESGIGKFEYRLGRYKDELRLGRRVFEPGESVNLMQGAALLLARLSVRFHESYADDFNRTYSSSDPRCFINRESMIEREARVG